MAELNDRGFRKAKKLGDIGEAAYAELLEGYKNAGAIATYYDLTDNRLAQVLDCDFVVFTEKDGDREYTEEDAEKFLLQKGDHPDFCHFIEVKTDTRILDTGNAYLEWIAHDKPGCFAITKADKWIYYGIDASSEKISRAWTIDLFKLRGLFTSGTLSFKAGTVEEYSDKKTGNYAFRVKMDLLVLLGVAKELKI